MAETAQGAPSRWEIVQNVPVRFRIKFFDEHTPKRQYPHTHARKKTAELIPHTLSTISFSIQTVSNLFQTWPEHVRGHQMKFLEYISHSQYM